ncbi:hypothetical protein QVD99_003238 [Batrachochytrium dendrobatidis]|nr:hypothetical protein QVD99_003238 [Batrachochytrium dendrobatidis]
MVWYRFRHRGLGQIMTETKQTPYREVCVEGEWDGWEMSEDDVQRHGVQGPCPEDNGVRRPRPEDWRIGGRTMSKWTMSQGPRPNVPRTRGPRPKVMAFLNDKLTQCLYKTMLKQQHCTSQGQTVMN